MSINNLNTYLNIKDSHLRVVSGNVYAQAMNIGGINVETAHGLQSVSDTGNVTSNTLQFSNATTGFITTANAQIGRDLVVSGNATVSTDLTVSANATVTDTLTISEHLIASKEATVTGNLHVTTIRSDSNVVAEYTGPHDRPLRKYPEVALTSASDSGYVTSSSTTVGTYYTWNAFDNNLADDSSVWTTVDNIYDSSDNYAYDSDKSLGGVDGEWLKIELPNKIKPSYVRIHPRTYSPPIGNNQSPEDFKILASNDDLNWVELVSVVGWVTSATWGKWDIPSNTPYKYFAIICTRTIGAATFGLAELEYYGYEEGSGSLDTTLKSVYNVPATTGTQLEVYYDGQDYSDMPTVGSASVIDKAGGDQTGTPSSGVSFDSTYKAFVFDGTANGKIEGTHGLGTGTGIQYSMSLWFKADVLGGNHRLATFGTQGTQYQSSSLLIYQNDIHIDHWTSEIKTTSDILVSNVWYHLVATHTGPGTNDVSQNALYLNGVKLEDVTTGGSAGNGTFNLQGTGLTIGADSAGTNPFTGSIANFRLYSKALNAGQVKELYDYQKDYFLGSKSQVTLYKGHLGVGVTEPSGQLELAGDERLQEYPPGPMSGYETLIPGHGVFCAYASSYYINSDTYAAWRAFNQDDATFWVSDDTDTPETYDQTTGLYTGTRRLFEEAPLGEYIVLKLPYSINLKSFTIGSRLNTELRAPKSGIVYGSKNNKWEVVHSFSSLTYTTAEKKNIQVNPNEYYNEFALVTTALGPSGDTYHNINLTELKFFGTPGPTTLDKGSLTLGRSLDVPRVSRYDVDTETPRPEKLVVDFDTTVNSSPTDISGNGNNGVIETNTAGPVSYSAADKAFDCTAGNGNIFTDILTPDIGSDPICSMSAWFKTTNADTTDVQTIMHIGDQSARTMMNIQVRENRLATGMRENTNHANDEGVATGQIIESNRWYHVVGVKSGTGALTSSNIIFKLYLDGEDVGTPSLGSGGTAQVNIAATSRKLLVGGSISGGSPITGFISNPKLYNVALEPSEVKKLYNLGRTGRSMVISDTAVGIGKVPEAQLDVRGNLGVSGHITNSGPRLEICDDSTGVHGYGTSGKGVKFSHAGIVFDRTWGNYPSLGVFTKNIDGTTNQAEFRIHGFDQSYISYPDSSGEADFGVVTRCDGGYQSGSDRRMKINITTIDEALKKVCLLTGKRYQLINRNGDINKNVSQNSYNYGLIAQDIEKAGIDEIYKHNEHEDDKTENYNSAYSINYDSIVPILINAIKEIYNELQAEKVVTTENKDLTRELRIENNRLKSKVAILENRQTHFNTLLVNLIGRVETLERPA